MGTLFVLGTFMARPPVLACVVPGCGRIATKTFLSGKLGFCDFDFTDLATEFYLRAQL